MVFVGLLQPAVELEVRGKSQELNVSWLVLPLFSDSVQEYVVQQKPVGLSDSACLNWFKVPKKQTFVTLRGRSLHVGRQFTIIHDTPQEMLPLNNVLPFSVHR